VIDEPTRRLDEGALRGFGRDLIPRVLAGLVRRGEDFDAAEDALQEALLERSGSGPSIRRATRARG
jgi:predicted RNA polymerase sigma factor